MTVIGVISIGVALSFAFSSPTVRAERLLDLEVGSSIVLRHPSVHRLAVGNSQVVQASALSSSEAILFGKRAGSTTVTVWTSKKTHLTYRVHVKPEGNTRALKEISDFLAKIPSARSTSVGGRIQVEGDDLTDTERESIARLAARYPELVEYSNHAGWDRMVMLDVQVIEIPTARMRELGVRWDTDATLTMQASRLALTTLISARLAALSKSGEAIVLAQPQLLARSGSTASFSAGGEVPYTTQDKDGKSNTTFKKYGVHLNITPHVGANLGVRSKIEIEVSTVDQSLASTAGPALKVRRASTEFNVRSGQTLVLGGFISREQSQNTEGIPGLSDIPVLGHLFGAHRTHRAQTELAIFVTPIVVDANNADLAKRKSIANDLLRENFPEPLQLNGQIRQDARSTEQSIFEGQWGDDLDKKPCASVVNQWE